LVNFKFHTLQSLQEEGLTHKGKPITCKYCKFQFKIIDSDSRVYWKENKMFCPSCETTYCVLPKTERDLQILQEDFVKDVQNIKNIKPFKNLLKSYVKSLILKRFTTVVNDPDDINDYADITVSRILEKYYVKENFRIYSSFATFALFQIKYTIWNKTEHLIGDESIHQLDENNKLKNDYGSNCLNIKSVDEEIHIEDSKEVLYNYLLQLFNFDKPTVFKTLNSVLIFIKHGSPAVDRFYKNFGVEGKHRFNYSLQKFKQKLMESNSAND